MIRTLAAAALLVVVAGSAGCTADPSPAPSPSVTPVSGAPTPTPSASPSAVVASQKAVAAPAKRTGELARTVSTTRDGHPYTVTTVYDTTKKAIAADDWVLQMACSAPSGTSPVSLAVSVADASEAPAPGQAARVVVSSSVECDGAAHDEGAQGLGLGRKPVQIDLGLGDAQQVTAAWAVLVPAASLDR